MVDIDVILRNDFLLIADTYAMANKIAAATVSKRFHGKQQFIEEFRSGASTVTLAKLREMVDDFSDQWPPNARWPGVRILSRPPRRGTIYIVRWTNDKTTIRIGHTAGHVKNRMAAIDVHEQKAGKVLELLGCVKGNFKNERSVHRFLEPHARGCRERTWYRLTPEVRSFVDRMLSPDFSWGKCSELIESDLQFHDDNSASQGRRVRKNRPQVSAP